MEVGRKKREAENLKEILVEITITFVSVAICCSIAFVILTTYASYYDNKVVQQDISDKIIESKID